MRQAVWVRSDATRSIRTGRCRWCPIGEDCACQRVAVAALSQAGRECDFVFTSRSIVEPEAAVGAGFGVMVMPRSRRRQTQRSAIWEDAPLPALPQIFIAASSCARASNWAPLEELADDYREPACGREPTDRPRLRRRRRRHVAQDVAAPDDRRPAGDRASVSSSLALGRGGRNDASNTSSAFGLGLEGVGQRDLVDRLFEPRRIDRAEAVGPHLGRDDVVPDRHAQALELDLLLGDVVALEHRIDRVGRVAGSSPSGPAA